MLELELETNGDRSWAAIRAMGVLRGVSAILALGAFFTGVVLCSGCGESEAEKKAKVNQAVQEVRERPGEADKIFDEKKLGDYADLAVEPFTKLLKEKDQTHKLAAMKVLGKLKKPVAVPTLLVYTKSDNPNLRAGAARALGSIAGADAVRALIDMAQDKDMMVRTAALEAMGGVGDKQVLPYLTAALADSEPKIRAAAVAGLVGLGALALQPVVELAERGSGVAKESAQQALQQLCEKFRKNLGSDDRLVRRDMARYLGQLRYHKAVPDLLDHLGSKETDPEVRAACAASLGEIKARASRIPLRERMEDNKEENAVRLAAAVALGKMGDRKAIKFLIERLEAEEEVLRVRAANALGEIGKPAVPLLMKALLSDKLMRRWGAAKALGDVGAKDAVPALIRVLRDKDENVRVAAAASLGRIKDSRAVEALLTVIEDPSPRLRWYAEWSLEQIGARAVPALVKTLKTPQAKHETKMRLLRLLGRIKEPSAKETLRQMASAPSDELRASAVWALGQIIPLSFSDEATLLAALVDASASVRREAALVLGKAKLRSARSALIEAWKREKNASVRAACLQAISQIDGKLRSEAELLVEAR